MVDVVTSGVTEQVVRPRKNSGFAATL
jgi:hypothetical protein